MSQDTTKIDQLPSISSSTGTPDQNPGPVQQLPNTNSADNVKTVYQSKAVTDIRKLVTEGYIKIDRTSQDVSISTEKATL